MERSEIETQILINNADEDDGFFIFSTTNRKHYNRVLKRIGEGNTLDVHVTSHKGKVTSWTLKLPISYLSKSTFGIRRATGVALKKIKSAKGRAQYRPGQFQSKKER